VLKGQSQSMDVLVKTHSIDSNCHRVHKASPMLGYHRTLLLGVQALHAHLVLEHSI
jgi:hypothetical protein